VVPYALLQRHDEACLKRTIALTSSVLLLLVVIRTIDNNRSCPGRLYTPINEAKRWMMMGQQVAQEAHHAFDAAAVLSSSIHAFRSLVRRQRGGAGDTYPYRPSTRAAAVLQIDRLVPIHQRVRGGCAACAPACCDPLWQPTSAPYRAHGHGHARLRHQRSPQHEAT